MRQRKVLLTCILGLGLLFFPDRDANAFWKYIGELSGPGPFVGLDLLFPWSLSNFDSLTNEEINRNRPTLYRMGVDVPRLSTEVDDIPGNPEHCMWLTRVLALDPTLICAGVGRGKRSAVAGFPAGIAVDSPAFDRLIELIPDTDEFRDERAALARAKSNDDPSVSVGGAAVSAAATAGFNREIARSLRRFGGGPAGLFGSKQALPTIRRCSLDDSREDCENKKDAANNWFFNIALGVAFSLENNLDYAPDFDKDKDVVWLSLYPNIEKRFRINDREDQNFFWNAGVVVNRFLGAGFDDFTVWSARTRIGYRIFPFHFGGELDFYGSAFLPEDFAAVPDDADRDRIGWALFLGLELTRPLR